MSTRHAKVFGIDHAEERVAFTRKTNAHWIELGRVKALHISFSELPFPDGIFDLVTAVETLFWWTNIPAGMAEILKVRKPDSRFIVIPEIYKGANTTSARLAEKYASKTSMKLPGIDEHREFFVNAGYSDVQVVAEPCRAWICAIGRKS